MMYVDVQPRCWWGQDWILPRRVILAVLLASLVLLLIGIILLAIGLSSAGGVLTGLGGCGLMILLLLGLHAYCCRYTRDVYTQTGVQAEAGDDIPSYAVIQKPSSLKRSDSGSKRNGRTLEKHVTLAAETDGRDRSGQITVAPSTGQGHVGTVHQIPIQHSNQSQMYSQQNSFAQQTPIYKPSGQMYAPPIPMTRGVVGQTYAPTAAQYPMQVYPVKTASSTSSSIRYGFDDDYDNPAETTPMLNQQHGGMSSVSYSSKQSGISSAPYSSQQGGIASGSYSSQQGGIASGSYSSQQGGISSAPYSSQQGGISSGSYSSQGGMSSASYSTQFRSSSSTQQSSAGVKGGQRAQEFDIPEPAPLQYPSAKRPMTFEQTSSSKMSVYDNLASGYPEGGAV